MIFFRLLKSKKVWAACASFILCAFTVYFMMGFIFFPEAIRLVEGQQHELNFSLPIRATFETEAYHVLQVNHKPVTESTSVGLSGPITIQSDQAGRAHMTLNAFGLPLRKVTLDILPDMEVIPCGLAVGVRIDTPGVMVLGTGPVESADGSLNPSEGILLAGDLILKANGSELRRKEDLITAIRSAENYLQLKIKRNEEILESVVNPVQSAQTKENKIGAWVRDSTQGIGTITYFNPQTNRFGALGHGIQDVDTKKMLSIKEGKIMPSDIVNVKKGQRGTPGELVGEIQTGHILGSVESNSPFGIFGTLDYSAKSLIPQQKFRIAMQDQVEEGPATILTTVEGTNPRHYDIFIETVNRHSSDNTRGMIIRITDPDLLRKTNGIVQGMSGSPILQNDRLVGAITHVFVQDPTKGYGIFIENMLAYEKGK